MKPTFLISCPIDTYSGYGARSRDLVKSIIESNKYDVSILPQMWGNTRWGFLDKNSEWSFLKKYLKKDNRIDTQPDIWMQITVPNEFQKVGKHFSIGVTAGIETTACAPQWIEGINRMDLTLVPSKHSKEVFEQSQFEKRDNHGRTVEHITLQKPIEVLFEGLNLDVYKKVESTNKDIDLSNIKESFGFLFVGHWMQGQIGEDRKNVGLLVKSFCEVFKNISNSPALILKTSNSTSSYMDREIILEKINEIKKTIKADTLPNIYLIHGDLTDKEINQLYNHPKVKAMVSLTKGEGYGRPLIEFTQSNKPILTTNWSGHIDFLNPRYTNLINGELKPVHPSAQIKDMIIAESNWFNPNLMEVGIHFNKMFNNYKFYKENAKKQAAHCKNRFSMEHMSEALTKILDKIEIPEQIKLKLPEIETLELPELTKL